MTAPDLLPWVYAFLTSYVLIAPFVVWLRPRFLTLVLGGTILAAAALFLEVEVSGALSPVVADVLVLVALGPLIEETLKFLASGATGANFASAAGAGIGFAATENALYFWAAWGGPLDALIFLIAIRAMTDPLLHSTAATLSTLTWRGRAWGFPAAVALHASWNMATLVYVLVNPTEGLVLLAVAGFSVFGIMLLLRRSTTVRDELDNAYRLRPWSGTEAYAGA